jgi:hypothetical protein
MYPDYSAAARFFVRVVLLRVRTRVRIKGYALAREDTFGWLQTRGNYDWSNEQLLVRGGSAFDG